MEVEDEVAVAHDGRTAAHGGKRRRGQQDEKVVDIAQVVAVSDKRVVVQRLDDKVRAAEDGYERRPVDNAVAARLHCAEQLTDNGIERKDHGRGNTVKERLKG